jgi:hypothetical protein
MKWNEGEPQQTVETKLYLELNWGAHLQPEPDQLRRIIQLAAVTHGDDATYSTVKWFPVVCASHPNYTISRDLIYLFLSPISSGAGPLPVT